MDYQAHLEIHKIIDGLYLSGHIPTRDRETLLEKGITHIVNAANAEKGARKGEQEGEKEEDIFPCFWSDTIQYMRVYIDDDCCEQIDRLFPQVLQFIDAGIHQHRGQVLIHCQYGISRSASLVIAYLMWKERLDFLTAFRRVKAIRDIVQPNPGFVEQLYEFGEALERCEYNLLLLIN